MAALCRLAVLSFLFGGVLYFLIRAILFADRLLLAPCSVLSAHRGLFRPRVKRAISSVCCGFLEAILCVLAALLWAIFLYAAAEGIPRLFSFVLGGAGALLSHRLLSGRLQRLEGWLFAHICAAAVCVLRPVRALLGWFGRGFYRIFSFFALRFIKTSRGIYTTYVAYRYGRTAPRRWGERRMMARLDRALGRGEEG